MKTLFETVSIGNLTLKNRLIRSAALEAGAIKDGRITPLLCEIYEQLADGGVGLIITGMMGVWHNACLGDGMAKIYAPDFEKDFESVVKAVHEKNCRIVVQLGHCGAFSKLIDEGNDAYAPSDITLKGKKAVGMNQSQIDKLVCAYGEAALHCKNAGADGVQIHAAHGYLISQFLSPYFNHRTDRYGGALQGRSLLLFEVYDEIRRRVGSEYPVLVKINRSDLIEGGLDEEECLWACQQLEQRGLTGIELSAGLSISRETSASPSGRKNEGYNLNAALNIAQQVQIPIFCVGGFRSLTFVEDALNRGNLVAISMCRPLIRNPQLPNQWKVGTVKDSDCISCSRCFTVKKYGCALRYGQR